MFKFALAAIALATASSPASAAWHEASTPHFLIYADHNPAALQRFAENLEKFDKAVRIVRTMEDPPLGNAGRLTIFVLGNADAVARLVSGKSTSIAGVYYGRAAGSVAFVPKESLDKSLSDFVFFHEYAHHLMLQNADVAVPTWLAEGFAEFFSTAEFPRPGVVQLGKPAEHRAYGLFNAVQPKIQDLLAEGFDSARTGEELDRLYGRSWLLTHYLTFDPERDGQVRRYASLIQAGQTSLDAARSAFGDLDELNRKMDSYLRHNRMKFLTISASDLKSAEIRIRRLAEGEARIIPVRIKSTRGANKTNAAAIAAEARAIATAYSADATVQTALAEAEFDAQNYAAAEAAADRALKVNPQHAQALIYKGRARMAAASDRTTASEWAAIRSLFSQANRLDPEDAEPLMQYYESFRAAGERPTTNAVKGLDYALLLSPNDTQLRMMMVGQLISEKKFDAARRTLATLAYSPHASEGRDFARKMMGALSQGNPESALAELAGFEATSSQE